MNSNKFTIQKYSGMAGVFLLLQNGADAQAVYTDIEPDIEIQFDGQTAGIDMDNNGTFDFAFLKTSGSYDFWNGSSTVWRFRQRIWAGPEMFSNEIAGDYFYYSAGGGITYFPYALLSGTPVNDELSFQNWGFQIMAMGHFAITFISSDTVWNGNVGDWAPDIENQFLGVRFRDNEECLRYGWIRCTTADSSKRLIIHDYCFESKCETQIIAGDTIGDTTGVDIQVSTIPFANVYSFNKTIYVNTNVSSALKLELFNLHGESIIFRRLNQVHTEINMNEYPPGIYFVKLYDGDKMYLKEISIN